MATDEFGNAFAPMFSLIERVILRKNMQRQMIFLRGLLSRPKCAMWKIGFSNITYKEGMFYQKWSELDFRRCGSGRKSENRYPNWR